MDGEPIHFPLGPFVLERVLGRGGMAVVWEARHATQGHPAAVKILTGPSARNPHFLKSFRSEARGASALDHPGIVAVYDHGVVGRADAVGSGGELVEGSPYLVMEQAGEATLAPHQGQLPWSELSAVLLSLLDALAHAHARGVVHRDLKPANVLVDGEGRVRLTDFGLAHGFTSEEAGALGAEFIGTPGYMAPEQLEVRWRDYGPWTDLYGLGCLAWALTTGEPPFGAALTAEQALHAQLRQPIPPLLPVHRVPHAYEGWLRRLLAREPRQRFQRAADAAWALSSLGPVARGIAVGEERLLGVAPAHPVTVVTASAQPASRPPTEPVEQELFPSGEITGPPSRAQTTPGTMVGGGMGEHPRIPPFPDSWRRPPGSEGRAWLHGVGLGTYGLRSVPMVDRETERDRLWAALSAVRRQGHARAVVLEGPAGCGKTRLAGWVAERAHETGAATVLWARHDPGGGPGHGLGPMLARFGRVIGLGPEQARRRIARLLAERGRFREGEIDAVAELLRPRDQPRGPKGVHFGGPGERHAAVRGLLEVLGRERPVVLVLDDVHHAAESLAFCGAVLARRAGLPLLLVMTARDDLLAERPEEAALLRSVLTQDGAESVPVGPLPRAHWAALVRGLLGLEGGLAIAVEQRTAGNPLFAVQLVGDWVQRGLLEPGESGFRLREGAQLRLPDDLHAVWEARIERALQGTSRHAQEGLELAGVLGLTVDLREWEEACGLAEVEPPHALVELLADQRLASLRPDSGVWSFAHGMLAECLVRRAADRGRLEGHHKACAGMLAGRRDTEGIERRGRHLAGAGSHREALEPLARAVAAHLNAGERPRASSVLTQYEQSLGKLRRPDAHPAALRGSVLRARVARVGGELLRALSLAQGACEALAGTGGEGASVYREALIELGNCLVHKGELAEAREHLTAALELALRQGAQFDVALCRRQLAYVLLSEGDVPGATRQARESVFAAEEGGDPAEVANGYQILSRCVLLAGRSSEAGFLLEEARLRFARAGARWGVATALNSLGEIARDRGDVREAERAYREAADRYQEIGSKDGVYPKVNLGLLLVEQRRWRDAMEVLVPLSEEVARQRRGAMEAAVAVAMLPPLAAFGQWEQFDRCEARAGALLSETGFVEPDLARKAALGGEVALARGEQARAARAYSIARSQWQGLGRADEADAIAGRIDALPVPG